MTSQYPRSPQLATLIIHLIG